MILLNFKIIKLISLNSIFCILKISKKASRYNLLSTCGVDIPTCCSDSCNFCCFCCDESIAISKPALKLFIKIIKVGWCFLLYLKKKKKKKKKVYIKI